MDRTPVELNRGTSGYGSSLACGPMRRHASWRSNPKQACGRCVRTPKLAASLGAIAPGVSIVRSLRVTGAQTPSTCALMLTQQSLRDVLGCSAHEVSSVRDLLPAAGAGRRRAMKFSNVFSIGRAPSTLCETSEQRGQPLARGHVSTSISRPCPQLGQSGGSVLPSSLASASSTDEWVSS